MNIQIIVLIAAIACGIVGVIACVLSAVFALKASRAATALHSMTSLQGELIDIRDYMGKLDKWAKRINARETQTAHRAKQSANGHDPSSPLASNSKDELRRRAGLIAGQPARHTRETDS